MIYCKHRTECSQKELDDFVRLLDGEPIAPLVARIELFAFAYEGEELISTRVLKRPFDIYRRRIFVAAQMESYHSLYPLESGYSYTKPCFRKNRLSSILLRNLLADERYKHAKVYATTLMHNTPVIRVMLANNGKPIGRPFVAENGKDMVMIWKLR